MPEPIERNLGLDLVRVTETAAIFSATGVTGGDYLRGVDFSRDSAYTHSVIMRSKTGSIRNMDASHNFVRLREISSWVLD